MPERFDKSSWQHEFVVSPFFVTVASWLIVPFDQCWQKYSNKANCVDHSVVFVHKGFCFLYIMNCGLRVEIWQPEALLFGSDSGTILKQNIFCSTKGQPITAIGTVFCLVNSFYIYSWASTLETHRGFEFKTSGAQHAEPPKCKWGGDKKHKILWMDTFSVMSNFSFDF